MAFRKRLNFTVIRTNVSLLEPFSEGGDGLVCLHLAFGKIGLVRLASTSLCGGFSHRFSNIMLFLLVMYSVQSTKVYTEKAACVETFNAENIVKYQMISA